MIVSTKGRYALRVMIDLAEHNDGEFIPLREISDRQGISKKYLESIVGVLSKRGFVEGASGKNGGYRLNRELEEYRIGDILRAMEGSLAPVSCIEEGCQPCQKAELCYTLPIWQGLTSLVNQYFDSMTLADVMQNAKGNDCQSLKKKEE